MAALPEAAAGHSLLRPAGSLISYLSQDATSLNTLTVRPSGNRIEFHDPTVDGGIDPVAAPRATSRSSSTTTWSSRRSAAGP